MHRFTSRAALSLAAASLCFLSIPVALASGDDGAAPATTARIAPALWACAPVDPPVDPTIDPTDTTVDTTVEPTVDPTDDTTDPTIDDAIIDDSSESVDGSEGIDPTDAIDPTDTTVEDTTDPTSVTVVPPIWIAEPCWYGIFDPGICRGWERVHIDPPVIDPPDFTIEPQDPTTVDTTEPTDTTIDSGEPTDTTESTDTTDDPTGPVDIVDVPTPRVYCMMKLPDSGVPLGVSEHGSMSVTGLDPAVLPADNSFDGGVITIYGTGFQPGATVMIGDLECTSVEVLSDTSLTCDPPVGAIGSYDVVITNADGSGVVAPAAFDFADPAGFWVRPVYAFSTNPLERSITTTTTAPTGSGAETLADTGIGAEAPAIPVFTG